MLSIKNFNLDLNLMIYYNSEMSCIFGRWDFLILFGAFFIKLPIYLFHIWLPKAPVYGSILDWPLYFFIIIETLSDKKSFSVSTS